MKINKQSQKAGENVTSDSTDEQEKVSRDKMIKLTNHYDEKIKMMCEESDILKGKLDEANKKLDNVHLPGELKSGVQECCEFINIHATKGAIISGLLLWADIKKATS